MTRETAPSTFDVVVVGGTPGGLATAVAAARLGHRVALVEHQAHLGGMSASGLGKSDIENRNMIGGLFLEFVERIHRHYLDRYGPESPNVKLCREGYYYEPSVAEQAFEAMLAEQPQIQVFRSHQLESAQCAEGRVREVVVAERRSGRAKTLEGRVLVDATYEGDLYAMAGAPFRLGRESREEFEEPHAGVVYFDYESHEFLPGTTGRADARLPACTYRLCLTVDPANSFVLEAPPPAYDRRRYLPYLDDLAAGRLDAPRQYVEGWGYYPEHFGTLVRALSVTDLPNGKVDANINPRPLAFPFAEENTGYVEGGGREREAICRRHRDLTLGLLFFLQNDPDVPTPHREIARRYHLPLDEFVDNGHFPFQLYVREARRLRGRYTLTEHDVTRLGGERLTGRHHDAIAVGEFPVDSFPTRRRQPTDDRVLEGYLGMLAGLTRPYQIPYRIMLPEDPDGLLVPVAASASHVAYSSIRMEPTWMAMGHAAGVAAHVVVERDCACGDVPISELQRILADQGQVLEPALAPSRSP
jgi:hypothetical protein